MLNTLHIPRKLIFLLFFLSVILRVKTDHFRPPQEIVDLINKKLTDIRAGRVIPTIPEEEIINPKVSVVVPCRNCHDYLRLALTSIQMQTLKELEIVFVEDGSTDDSYEIMQQFTKEDKRVRIQKNKGNKGILYSRTSAALTCKGEYVAFLDVDDMYFNENILKESYDMAKANNLDLIQFKNFGGNYTAGIGYSTYTVFTTPFFDKEGKVLVQPEIKRNYFLSGKEHDLLSGIVYDKLYRKDVIDKMADYMGEFFWKQNLSYFEDYIIILGAVRSATRFMLLPGQGGVWHWYNNPEGMTGKFEIVNGKLLHKKLADMKMASNLAVIERVFDIHENDPEAGVLVASGIYLMGKHDMNRQVMALCSHHERYLKLITRYINWQFADEKFKTDVKKMGFIIILIRKDDNLAFKYNYLFEKEPWYTHFMQTGDL
ncbi:MAG: glycosyltransferase [archaeon]|nr:glycosyltransferase [archaeon]